MSSFGKSIKSFVLKNHYSYYTDVIEKCKVERCAGWSLGSSVEANRGSVAGCLRWLAVEEIGGGGGGGGVLLGQQHVRTFTTSTRKRMEDIE